MKTDPVALIRPPLKLFSSGIIKEGEEAVEDMKNGLGKSQKKQWRPSGKYTNKIKSVIDPLLMN